MTRTELTAAYHLHKDVVYRFATRMTGSAAIAEDIAQDCFLALWNQQGSYDSARGPLRPFLLGIARNLILKRWRAERPAETLEDDRLISEPFDVLQMERAEAIAAAIAALPPLQRETIILAEYEGSPLDEIVQVTGAELAAVNSRLHRARENLRRILAPLVNERSRTNGR